MRVKVNEHLCQGHAMCTLACPEIFVLNDIDGHANVPDQEVPPELRHAVVQAANSCPEGAIELS